LRAILKADGDATKVNPVRIALKPWFVPDTASVQAQLNAFLKRKTHFALVVDEYGEVQGLVTLEGILEEIVGGHHRRTRCGDGWAYQAGRRLLYRGRTIADPRCQPHP